MKIAEKETKANLICRHLLNFEKGYVMFPEGKPWVRHADFRDDPELHALGTPSGFIEIFSNKIAGLATTDVKGIQCGFEKPNVRTEGRTLTNLLSGCNSFPG